MKRLFLAVVLSAFAGTSACREVLAPGFPHRMHLTSDACGGPGEPPCPTCVSCHEAIRRDIAGLPGSSVCRECHGAETDALLARVRPTSHKRTDITFSHEQHLSHDTIRGQCVTCHAGVASDGRDGALYPVMKDCLDCHADGLEAGRCADCHQRTQLRSLLPETFLQHDERFFRRHGMAATRHQDVCNQCHSESECVRCHDQSQPIGLRHVRIAEVHKPLNHRGNFEVHHAVDARAEGGACLKCHSESYCDSCHVQRGVSANARGSINPHPIGWVGPDPTAPTFHGRAARRDILSCASCHEAGPATNCIRCHSVGGPGGNPHPSGWKSLRSEQDGMCAYCHVP